MAYATDSGSKLSLSAVTTSPTKEVEVMWTIEHFKMLAHYAKAKNPQLVRNQSAYNFDPHYTLTEYTFSIEPVIKEHRNLFKVKLVLSDNFDQVGLYFYLVESSSPVSMASISAAVVISNKEIISSDTPTPIDFKRTPAYGWTYFFHMQNVDYYLTPKGKLNIKIKLILLTSSGLDSTKPEVCFPESDSKLNTDLRGLFNEEKFTDVVLKVSLGEEKLLKCHKAILSARSPVFRAMFESDNLESRTGVVEICDFTPEIMEQFLSFVYSGRFTKDSSSLWPPLLPQLAQVADKYCVIDLLEFCDKYLKNSVTTENAVLLVTLARRLHLEQATKDLQSFIATNIKNIF